MTANERERHIWNYLRSVGMSDAGAAGLMGNLYAESALNPTNLQNSFERSLGYSDDAYTAAVDSGAYKNFVKDSAGYGLAQWTYYTRKQKLLDHCKAIGKSIGDLDAQLEFLYKELCTGYPVLLTLLKAATSVKTASDAVLTQFERPADQSETAKSRRASYGQGYYDKYHGKEGFTVTEQDKKDIAKMVYDMIKADQDKENPIIKDYKDCPAYFQKEAKAFLDSGAINGGTPSSVNALDMNVRFETLKAAIIAARACDARHSG